MTPADGIFGGFSVTVGFEGTTAVLGVRGEVGMVRAPELGAVLGAVIDRHRAVVLDLVELDSLDASGLAVIAQGASRLRQSGGELTIRWPSSTIHRPFALTGLDALRLELPEPNRSHLGAEQPLDGPELVPPSAPPGLVGQRRTVTAVPADHDVVDGALRLVVALARATVGGADGVSVSLRRHGQLATVAATDQTISDMDADQYATGEGPCVDASGEGRWFHAESLGTETRWPAFTPRARALGINAILSSPLLTKDRPVGALNIYSRSVAAFGPKDQELAAVFASEASTILASAAVDVTDEQLAAGVGESLRIRQIIAQAEGVIMEREGIGEEAAYTVLRDFSQRSNRPLRERARDVVASTQWPLRGIDPGPSAAHRG
jgi:anti-anti-sigma factor